ncbi:MAG: hypothetical protein KGL74_02845 [Elusimicrobia bacterium]|nr:hypothetical protein [Elusimicrobiota bacterium]
MTGMELYVKFMFTLTLGLAGVGLVLKTILETILSDWDPVVDARRWWKSYSHRSSAVEHVRAEDILQEIEGRRAGGAPRPPLQPLELRRESLRDVEEAEQRLSSTASA